MKDLFLPKAIYQEFFPVFEYMRFGFSPKRTHPINTIKPDFDVVKEYLPFYAADTTVEKATPATRQDGPIYQIVYDLTEGRSYRLEELAKELHVELMVLTEQMCKAGDLVKEHWLVLGY